MDLVVWWFCQLLYWMNFQSTFLQLIMFIFHQSYRLYKSWGLTLVECWVSYLKPTMSFLIAFKHCHQRTTKWISNNWLEVDKSWSNDISFRKPNSGFEHTPCQVIQSTESEATHCTGKSFRSVQWRPKTSSLCVVCWNAKCFPSSDASSIPRCPTPVHAAFGVLPGSTGTTWVNE